MTPSQIAEKIVASQNFQWRAYADAYSLHGVSSDETIDNIVLHLERQYPEVLNMLFEANCESEAMEWCNEKAMR